MNRTKSKHLFDITARHVLAAICSDKIKPNKSFWGFLCHEVITFISRFHQKLQTFRKCSLKYRPSKIVNFQSLFQALTHGLVSMLSLIKPKLEPKLHPKQIYESLSVIFCTMNKLLNDKRKHSSLEVKILR